MSEGVNLHRASVLVNYDLPWNPTRVMQRLGRINRVGSEFDNIFIYNFFPSTSSKEYLSLEDAIKYKIQLFNQLLGSDQKLLTDEDVTSEFGLYDILMMTQTLPDEEEMTESATKMEYLQIINKLRKENIDMFDKIKNLPNKIKVARFYDYSGLLTFIKKGLIKRFYLCDCEEDPNEIIFEDAMKILETTLETKKTKLPEAYYKLLEKNYQKFILQMKEEINLDVKGAKLSRNENQVRNTIKFILKQEVLTYKEKEYFKNVQKAISYGRLDNLIFKNIVKSLESNSNDLKSMILAFKDNISSIFLTERKSYNIKDSRSENDTIVLSEYLIKR